MNQEHFDRIQTLKAKAIRNKENRYLNEERFEEWLDSKRRREYEESIKFEEPNVLIDHEEKQKKSIWIDILFTILPLSVLLFVASVWGW